MINSAELFSMALRLEEPWFVSEISFDVKTSRIDIHLDFRKGYIFDINGVKSTAYDTINRTWQHLNFFQHHCYLHARVPRVKSGDNNINQVEVPWARENSGFTLLFEALAMLLIESEMPLSNVGKVLGVSDKRISTIFKYWIKKAHIEDEVCEIKTIGFDETSVKKGHDYVTTMVDFETKRVLYVTEGKGAETIEKSVSYLQEKSVKVDEIERVCIDMSPSFISGCSDYLPHAAITFDKFHVVKEVNNAMDELRKLERKGNEMLKNQKYTFLKKRLSPEKEQERDILMELYPKLGEGYRLVEMFKDFWDIRDRKQAEAYLSFWCDYAYESGIFTFRKAINMIKGHWSGIMNYIESRINNGILEGINSKIQLAKKRARGYRNRQNFIYMIYFIAGKLKFSYPKYST